MKLTAAVQKTSMKFAQCLQKYFGSQDLMQQLKNNNKTKSK